MVISLKKEYRHKDCIITLIHRTRLSDIQHVRACFINNTTCSFILLIHILSDYEQAVNPDHQTCKMIVDNHRSSANHRNLNHLPIFVNHNPDPITTKITGNWTPLKYYDCMNIRILFLYRNSSSLPF